MYLSTTLPCLPLAEWNWAAHGLDLKTYLACWNALFTVRIWKGHTPMLAWFMSEQHNGFWPCAFCGAIWAEKKKKRKRTSSSGRMTLKIQCKHLVRWPTWEVTERSTGGATCSLHQRRSTLAPLSKRRVLLWSHWKAPTSAREEETEMLP
ncbi:hypothetical protein F5144DRAFT_232790 [Chaetomium tenue]|uniref:Uncharacterized protein n=1 Tax=Chaetomium tenue TaxID=1854479 RepID=A0ACB7P8M2_9PEZI|nr:hypothetical protein F5144DRAFT_232790 [Chaetomium globosum]